MEGGGRAFQYVRGNYTLLKGTNLTVAARRHLFYHPPGNICFSRRFVVTFCMQPIS